MRGDHATAGWLLAAALSTALTPPGDLAAASAQVGFVAELPSATRVTLGPSGRPDPASAVLFPPAFARDGMGRLRTSDGPRQAVDRHPATATLLSLAVPGVGQRWLGQRRGWAYLALEAIGWAFYLERRGAAGDLRDRYRDLAWEEARIQGGPRLDGDFEYYETLTQWARSGAFDTDPATTGVQPESDPATFNGSIWARAVGIFLPGGSAGVSPTDPGYVNAVDYYADRAYGDAFLWDWSMDPTAQFDFAELIERSDDRFRQATNVLGVVIANHVVSAVDAYLATRGAAPPVELRAAPGPVGAGWLWTARLRLEAPR